MIEGPFGSIKSKPKIVLLANTSWYIYNFRRSTIEMFIDNGYDVYTLAGDGEYAERLCNLGAKHKSFFVDRAGRNPLVETYTLVSLYSNLPKNACCVFSFTPKCNLYGSLCALVRRTPIILNISGQGVAALSKGLVSLVTNWLYKVAIAYASHVFFQNREDHLTFTKKFQLHSNVTSILPGSGVNLDSFCYRPLHRNKIVTFGLFTRLIEEKGVRIFIETVRLLRQKYEFTVIVAGALEETRSGAVTSLDIAEWQSEGLIVYKGMVSDVRPLIYQSDCVVLPTFYPEGTPRILIEAASCGRPLITCNVPGARDVVCEGGGFVVSPSSVSSLYTAMEKILNMSAPERAQMGKAGRAHVEAHYDEEIVLSTYRRVASRFL